MPPSLSLDATQLLLAFPLLITLYLCWSSHRPKYPPGPPGLPLLGNVLDMPTSEDWLQYRQWSREFNSDIIYLNVCGTHIVVTNTLDATLDLLEKRSSKYSSRPRMPMLAELMGWGWSFVLMPYGDPWRAHRRLAAKEFDAQTIPKYNHAFARNSYDLLRRLLESPEDWHQHVRHQVGAMIIEVSYGFEALPKNDPFIDTAEKGLSTVAQCLPGAFLVDTLPILKFVPSWMPGASFKQKAKLWRQYADETLEAPFRALKTDIANHVAKPSFALRCMQNLDPKFDAETQENVIKASAAAMYGAGADTTVSLLGTFVFAMMKYPEVQRKAQMELDSVVGANRLPTFEDMSALPYLNAIIKECHRWQVTVPFAIPHMLTEDDVYKGYFLPKGTMVMPNSWAILNDKSVYPYPSKFLPERFLKDGKLNPEVPDPEVAAFGYGRRVCPGKRIANAFGWLSAGCILASFDISKPTGKDGQTIEPEVKYCTGLIRSEDMLEVISSIILPFYSLFTTTMDALPVYNHDSDIPPPYEHLESLFHLKDRQNTPWATLVVQSTVKSSEGAPIFVQGDAISGSLRVHIRKRDPIRAITIKILGQFVEPTSSEKTISPFESGPDVFLSVSHAVWSREVSKSEGLPDGTQEWPFTIPITNSSSDPLPPSVLEKVARFGVRYEIYAHIRRGALRSDNKLGGVFDYFNANRPNPFSAARRLAYETDSPIKGPDADPAGWKTFEPVKIDGIIFSNRDVHIICTLSIAVPLVYTKGTAIPCHLVLESTDREVLDLLSSTNAIDIRLQRCVMWGVSKSSQNVAFEEALWRTGALDYPGSATWGAATSRDNARILDGEIQLQTRLPPSFTHGKFSISYNIAVFPFSVSSFIPASKDPALKQQIEVSDLHGDGPHANQRFPPVDAAMRFSHCAAAQDSEQHKSVELYGPSEHLLDWGEHLICLKDPNTKRIWANLKIYSSAKSPSATPVFKEGEAITGTLELDIQADTIQRIDIKLIGQFVGTISGPRSREAFITGPDTFLELSQPLWSRRLSGTTAEKLNGKHSWDISFALPTEATTVAKALPPTIQESNVSFGVRYEFFVHIRRSKLRADDKLGTLMTYMPRIKPDPPSALRRSAYQNETRIPGPHQDPEGWKTLPSILINGTVFSHRSVQIKCTLSYTQGTAIPTAMVLESTDAEALDLLSSPKAINVRLQRHIIWGKPTKSDKEALHPGSALDYPSAATWDPPIGGGNTRTLEGEIQLPKSLPPSFSFKKFSVEVMSTCTQVRSATDKSCSVIQYQVMIFPFHMTAFKPHDNGPLGRLPVDIANFFADGPRAKQLRPPIHGTKPVYMGSTLGNLAETAMTMFP
ncbi:hypothetical protein HWV62_4249 [Athelia sp. TMB]|nr:hypothetical protein HWV62_4249 [Athelia sp. TMB]